MSDQKEKQPKPDPSAEGDDSSTAEGDLELRDEKGESVKGGMTKQEFVNQIASKTDLSR
jgi:hypothetical protein